MYINIKSKLALWSPVLFLTGFISDICQGAAKDTNSESIIGTSVLVKKNNEWQYHGVRGLFFLEERKKSNIIVVSYVGYQIQEISWTGGVLNTVLKEDTEILNEEAIISYNTVRKADRAGSLAMPDNKKFKGQFITKVTDTH